MDYITQTDNTLRLRVIMAVAVASISLLVFSPVAAAAVSFPASCHGGADDNTDSSSTLGQESACRETNDGNTNTELSDDIGTELVNLGRDIDAFFESGIGLFVIRITNTAAVVAILYGVLVKGIFGLFSSRGGGGGGMGQAARAAMPPVAGGVALLFLKAIITLVGFFFIKILGGILGWLLDQI